MSFHDLLELLGKYGPVILGLCTIVTAVIWVGNLVRRLYKAKARIRRLERELKEALPASGKLNDTIASQAKDLEEARHELNEQRHRTSRAVAAANDYYRIADNNFRVAQNARAAQASAENEASEARLAATAAELAAEDVRREMVNANERIKEQEKALEGYETRSKSVAKHNGRVWLTPPRTKPPEFVPLAKRRTRVISILNLKGGVGKTTLTANLGGYLASCHEKWVMLLDLDHQRSLTQVLFSSMKREVSARARRTIQDFLLSPRSGKDLLAAAEQVQGESFARCCLIGNSDAEPGVGTDQNLDDLEMGLLARWLVNPAENDVRYLMRPALHSAVLQERFDYVLIDCPPRLTTACINALAASDFVLIPTEVEQVSARSVPHLLRRLRELREATILPDLKILGIVANMVSADIDDSRSSEAKILRETEGLALKAWGSSVTVLKSKIRESDFYPSCQREVEKKLRLPALASEAIGEQYERLTKEIEERIDESLGVARVSS
jgi:cellulose biosynthesis protein BcsQ